MPSRKLTHKGSNYRDRREEPKGQLQFTDVFQDEPASDIPEGTLAKAKNCIPYGNKIVPRYGTEDWNVAWPPIAGRTNYAAHKEGYIIVSDSGNIFAETDVQNYWRWDNGYADQMVEYIDAQHMRCRDNDYNSGTACWIQGRRNHWRFHSSQEQWTIQMGEDLYIVSRDLQTWQKVPIISYDVPNNSFSGYAEPDDYAYINNAAGLFKVIFRDTYPPFAYRLNSPIMNRRPTSNDDEGEKGNKYHYIIAVALLDGTGNFRNRETPVQILTESGTNVVDENRRDWAIINTEKPIGAGVDTYGVLDGGAGIDTDALGTWEPITDLAFNININNLGSQKVVVDCSGIVTMYDLADRIQEALRLVFPSATCQYITIDGAPRIRITSGKIAGGSIGYVTAPNPAGGTDGSAILFLTAATGAQITTPYIDTPHPLYDLYLPVVPNSNPIIYQWHWTHYIVYRTGSLGWSTLTDAEKKELLIGVHLEKGKNLVNSQDQFIWAKDLRVAAAFIARRRNGYIELRSDDLGGEFEQEDETCVVEFEDGSRVQIVEGGYVNPKKAKYTGADAGEYYGDSTDWMAACIGNGNAVRVTQTGTIVTRVPGSSNGSYGAFAAADVRRPIWWPNGYMSYIKRVISANSVEVWDDIDRTETGMTYAPSHRNFTDIISDEKLFARASAWTCKNRFMSPIPRSNIVIDQPGFLVFAIRRLKELYYCQLEAGYYQFVGYYNESYQKMTIEDRIMHLHAFPNRFCAMCQKSLWKGATNNAVAITIPMTEQVFFRLPAMDKVSSVGLSHFGSVHKLSDDVIRFVTNTGEIRDFDGITVGPNLIKDQASGLGRMEKALRNAYKMFASIYTRVTGYIIWWREKE